MSIRINNKIIAGNSSETKSTSYRYVGEIFQSAIPIDDIKVACLDGHKIYSDEGYGSFMQHLISQSVLYPQLVCTEEVWQEKVTQYGSWGQFVINTQENSVRLPKIAGFVQGLNTLEDLAGLLEAGLPNIKGSIRGQGQSLATGGTGCLKVTTTTTTASDPQYGASYYYRDLSLDASLSNPIYGNSDTVQPQAIQYPYYIVLATGVVQEINIKDEVELNNPFFFGMYQYFETNPNNVSWLKSEGQWNSGSIYESFYEWLVNSYNDTESDVSVKSYSDTYTNFDYVLNQNDKTFRLPIEVKQKFYNDLTGDIPVAGNGMTLGLTNGTNNFGVLIGNQGTSPEGVLLRPQANLYGNAVGTGNQGFTSLSEAKSVGLTSDPTKSGIEAQITQTEVEGLGLYFYVGEVVQNANIINVSKLRDEVKETNDKNKSYITNCITEIPQRIKLELNNGTLTLKAGSEVIVPNGFEADGTTPKFDYVSIKNDTTVITASSAGQFMILYKDGGFRNQSVTTCYSGSTQPTVSNQYATWYDTTANKVKLTNDKGATWISDWSLPFCLTTTNTNGLESVDQIFNGMGYIGSTIWVDKGVKGLIPNGRNEDGTLKNIEFTTQKVLTQTTSDTNNFKLIFTATNAVGSSICEYSEKDNLNINVNNGSTLDVVIAGTFTRTVGVVSNFQPKQPFRALDYNTPHIVKTYQNGTSWYRVWSDGWCEQGGINSSSQKGSITFLQPFKDTNYTFNATLVNSDYGAVYFQMTIHTQTTSNISYVSTIGSTRSACSFHWYTCGYIS